MDWKKAFGILMGFVLVTSIISLYFSYRPIYNSPNEKYEEASYVAGFCQNLCLYAKDLLSKQNETFYDGEILSQEMKQFWVSNDLDLSKWSCAIRTEWTKNISYPTPNWVEVDSNCTARRMFIEGVTKEPLYVQ